MFVTPDGGPPLGSDRKVVADQGGLEGIQLPFRKKKGSVDYGYVNDVDYSALYSTRRMNLHLALRYAQVPTLTLLTSHSI